MASEVIPVEQQQTDAMRNFETNLGLLRAFLNRLSSSHIHRRVKSFMRVIDRFKADPKHTKPLIRAVSKLGELTSEWLKASQLSHEWMSVMLVTFTEVYLEDGFVSLSEKNPSLMKDAPPIPSARMLEAESLDELRQEIRRQWAHQKVEGGPRKFVRRLKAMGARGYNDDDIYRLEHLWDTRNLIVHSRGIVDQAYVAKYKNREKGDHVKVNLPQIGWWLPALKNFVENTDKFFLSYGTKKKTQSRLSVVRRRGYAHTQ